MSLIYPGHPDFHVWLAVPPPDPGQNVCYVHRPGAAVAEAINVEVLDDYLLSGEYEARLDEIDGLNETEDTETIVSEDDGRSDVLYLPVSVTL